MLPSELIAGTDRGRDHLRVPAGRTGHGRDPDPGPDRAPIPDRRPAVSQQRADELELKAKQLAGFQVALLGALLRTLDLRDRMTARHSAAVARYSREIAAAAGLSEAEQELVHTAGLLHDIGKFVLPDRILKGDAELTEADWEEIKKHPNEGARIVSQIDGYQPVGPDRPRPPRADRRPRLSARSGGR